MNQGDILEPREIFLNAVLYKKFPRENADELENFDGTLDMYCLECKQDSVFKRLGKTPRQMMAGMTLIGSEYPDTEKCPRTFFVEFECSRDEDHGALFVFRIDEESISKIGEYPSRVDRQYPEIRKYEKELDSYYEELKMAVHLHFHNVGIGSFVYLRRVLEKVVYDVAVRKYGNQPGWSLERWKDSKKRFESIVEDLTSELPEFLVRNTVLYGILSKGIHELDEEECLEYFGVVKAAIEEILDDKMSRDEKKKRQDSVSGKLSQIHSNLKHRSQA